MLKQFFQMVACGIGCFLLIVGFFALLDLAVRYLIL